MAPGDIERLCRRRTQCFIVDESYRLCHGGEKQSLVQRAGNLIVLLSISKIFRILACGSVYRRPGRGTAAMADTMWP
jgi:histidinol-phosphate/aromatic aminotransferase/cobyric acid decarboxylase-like protein